MTSALRSAAVALLVVCSLVTTPGCKRPGPEPVMTVGLVFGDAPLACLEAGITLVDYTLFGAEGVVRREEGVPCADLLFSYIADDDYQLEVHGFDEEGVERFTGRCEGLVFEGEDVLHSCLVETAVAPLSVEVRWDTTQSAQFIPDTCWVAGVVRYNLVLRDAEEVVVDARAGVPCDGPDTVVIDYGSLPLGDYQLEVVGYSDDEVANWEADCAVAPGGGGTYVCDARDE